MDGLLIVDKPVGPTSHDVVARVRRATGERRVGHTGTLDPFASGVLPLVAGRATRLARFLAAAEKSYDAVVRLGIATDTYDAAGAIAGEPYGGPLPDRDAIERALEDFRGTYLQTPPVFSAKKIAGVPSYRLARRGSGGAAPAPVAVTVHHLTLVRAGPAEIELTVTCSAGFYVRSLAHDLGERLGTGAHLTALRRTRVGALRLDDAVALRAIEEDPAAAAAALIPPGRMLTELPAVTLDADEVRDARHGRAIRRGGTAAARGFTRLLDPSGDLIGMANPVAGLLHPVVILM